MLVRDCQSADKPLAWWRPWLIPSPPAWGQTIGKYSGGWTPSLGINML